MNAVTAPEAAALQTIEPAHGRSFKPLAERVIEKIDVTDGCWNWKGAVNANGYASTWNGDKPETASRVVYRRS